MEITDLNVHLRLFLRDIHKYCNKSGNVFLFGTTSLQFLKVRVYGIIVKKDLVKKRIVIDDSTGIICINLEPICLKQIDVSKLTVGTLMSVIGELKENIGNEKDESNRWIDCEGYDTYYEPHSELMFMLETMIFYKKRYFKEYFSEEEVEDIKLPSHSLVNNNKYDEEEEEWIPYFTNDIVRPEIMLKRDDTKIFDKNCQIIGNNNRKALEQSDITNKRNFRTKNIKNESLVLRDIDDNGWNYGNYENSEGINIKHNNENTKNIQNDINNKNSKENHAKVVRQVNNTKQILENR
ncbi:hypothetical protein Glove_120g150 [Diversispora epigaea]|uniref:CST complex subunit Stn1 N-terminal domain-containing protein n=1 Tax=Diversispora epigaea TaxID=1348612 RepID=A0A397IZR9_9GLOM|nr:hypothetical protein Glove_120g150 [Diversispora epigaea]